jgi:hypothetical protein
MRRLLIGLVCAGFAFALCAGCGGLQVRSGDERPFSDYDHVFNVVYETLQEYGIIKGSVKSADMLGRGAGHIWAEMPPSYEFGAKTKKQIFAFLTPRSYSYTEFQVRVSTMFDDSEPSIMTHGPEKCSWKELCHDKALEVKIEREIWAKLAGKQLAKKKKLAVTPYSYKDEERLEKKLALSASEQKVREALGKTMNVSYEKKTAFLTAINKIREFSGANIAFSAAARKIAEKETAVVTLKVTDLALADILNLLTGQLNLTWGVKSGVIFIDVIKKKPPVKKLELKPDRMRIKKG